LLPAECEWAPDEFETIASSKKLGSALLKLNDQLVFIVHGVAAESLNREDNSSVGGQPNVTGGGLRSLLLQGYFLVLQTFCFCNQKRYRPTR
jgi:hypothetical protein